MTRQPPPEVFDEAEPATLSDRYFAALGQTNRAHRSGDMLVHSGPQYTMRFIAE